MDTRPCRGCALLAAMQAAPQHPQIIIYQPEKPGEKEMTAALRSAHSAVETRLSEPCGLRGFSRRRWGSGPGAGSGRLCRGPTTYP